MPGNPARTPQGRPREIWHRPGSDQRVNVPGGRTPGPENPVNLQEPAAREPGFGTSAGSSRDRPDGIVECVKNAFMGAGRVVGARYAVLQDGTSHVVAVHAPDDRTGALGTIRKGSIEARDEFHGAAIAPLVLHEGGVRRGRPVGAGPAFLKTRRRIKVIRHARRGVRGRGARRRLPPKPPQCAGREITGPPRRRACDRLV